MSPESADSRVNLNLKKWPKEAIFAKHQFAQLGWCMIWPKDTKSPKKLCEALLLRKNVEFTIQQKMLLSGVCPISNCTGSIDHECSVQGLRCGGPGIDSGNQRLIPRFYACKRWRAYLGFTWLHGYTKTMNLTCQKFSGAIVSWEQRKRSPKTNLTAWQSCERSPRLILIQINSCAPGR